MMRLAFITMALAGLLAGCSTHKAPTVGDGDQTEKGNENMKKSMPAGRLLSVSYSYQGMMMEPLRNKELTRTDGTPTIKFVFMGDERQFAVSDTLFDVARAIIEEEEMFKYDGYYSFKSEFQILDGYSWSFDATFEGNERISSGGSNVEPRGDGLVKINKLLQDAAIQALKDAGEEVPW
ncbi:MAG: hypothetical protein II949_12155 [Prevotella sp.]|nr:hypothetical protein [Prevotella sp.]